MNIFFPIATWLMLTIAITACAPTQYVPNAYPTPSKSAGAGAAGAAVTALATANPPVALVGGLAGATAGHHLSRKSLMKNLMSQGVQVVAQGDRVRLILSADTFFEDNGVKLNPAHYGTLNYVAALLKEYGDTPIWVDGYTDNIHSTTRNKERSLEQARSVVAYLWVHGITFQHLYPRGFGEKDPIASNASASGSAENRRIEISLRDGCPNDTECVE